MDSEAGSSERWPRTLYRYLDYGWGGWLAVLAAGAGSVVWTGYNLFQVVTRGAVFVPMPGRHSPVPPHWASWASAPAEVVLWTGLDLVWLALGAILTFAAILWFAGEARKGV